MDWLDIVRAFGVQIILVIIIAVVGWKRGREQALKEQKKEAKRE